jgi:hypothetical protein
MSLLVFVSLAVFLLISYFSFTVYLIAISIARTIQSVPGGKLNILGGHSIGHSKQKSVYVHVSYSERFPRYSYFTVQYTIHCTDKKHAMSSHELQSALMSTVELSKMYYTR